MAHSPATIISALELRRNFGLVRKGLADGKRYIIVYRGEPVAELTPATAGTQNMFFTAPLTPAQRIRKNVKARKIKRMKKLK